MPADLAIAFAAGLASCASPCVLPLLPASVAYLGGRSPGSRRPVLGALLFSAGFGTAFTALGAGAGLAGQGVASFRPAVTAAAGALLVVLGVALLGGVPWLARERRLHLAHRLPRTPWAPYVVGVAFAAGWTPCVGPILAAVLLQAGSSATAGRGAALLAAYSAGLGLPFVAAAGAMGPVTTAAARVRGATPVLNAATAILLIGMGALTLTGRLTALNGLVPGLPAPQLTARLSAAAPPERPSLLVGRPAPAVRLAGAGGGSTSLAALRGRPLVVTFWATWCEPCREELPLLAAVARDRGLTLVAIDEGESAGAVSGFWAGLGLEPAPYLDPDGTVAGAFGVGPQRTGLPVTVLVAGDGTVRAVLPGQVDAGRLGEALDRLPAPPVRR